MATRFFLGTIPAILLVAVLGCSVAGPTEPGTVPAAAHNVMAIVEYGGGVDYTDPAVLDRYAQAHILVVQAHLMWRDDIYRGVVSSLKQRNPDLKVVGYVNAHSSWLEWGDPDVTDPDLESYKADWAAAMRPFWSSTTTGDTMMSWPGKIVVNTLDPQCREAMVGVLAKHWRSHGNVLDGIFWDHFNRFLWVMDEVPGREGDLDLDGNGIAHRDDEPEMEAYREASEDLILLARQVLGDRVVQVTNGNRAAIDSAFAGLVDGSMYEHFPEVGFSGDKMGQALDLSYYGNLFAASKWYRTRNGGPYVILSNTGSTYYQDESGAYVAVRNADLNRVVALLTGTLVAYHPEDRTIHFGWPEIEIDLGEPLGGARFEGSVISRAFERGVVRLDREPLATTVPFAFEIEQDGEVVQSAAMPAVHP